MEVNDGCGGGGCCCGSGGGGGKRHELTVFLDADSILFI